jgi:hypothetical protein
MDFRKLLTVPLAVFVLLVAVPGFAADVSELERRIDIMSDELDRVKNSSGGSGGGHKTSVHGYGEVHWGTDHKTVRIYKHIAIVIGTPMDFTIPMNTCLMTTA